MTEELAKYLIEVDKYIIRDGAIVDSFLLEINYPMNIRLQLAAPDDIDQNLMVNIRESEKKALKISLHHQDNSNQNGLLRIDYNSRHWNPTDIKSSVPNVFHAFAGLWLDNYAGHIHYVVDGYKPLAWAIPLEVDDFPVKQLNGNEDYVKTLKAFFDKINLRTAVTFNQQMRIL